MITKDLIVENTSLEEFFSIINDLVKNAKVQKMKIYNQHAHTSCYKHCMQVAYYTYIICKKLNLDYVSATRGAMLMIYFYTTGTLTLEKTRVGKDNMLLCILKLH